MSSRGTAQLSIRRTFQDFARDLSRYARIGGNGCWPWIAAKHSKLGYGFVSIDGDKYLAHRAAWVAFRGPIPKGKNVLHYCDNPGCVNPQHLWLGTQQQNIQDMIKKKRNNHPKGERHRSAKLNSKQVCLIYLSKRRVSLLAKQFGVGASTIYAIKSGKIWSHTHGAG